jgi:hypothetical protein
VDLCQLTLGFFQRLDEMLIGTVLRQGLGGFGCAESDSGDKRLPVPERTSVEMRALLTLTRLVVAVDVMSKRAHLEERIHHDYENDEDEGQRDDGADHVSSFRCSYSPSGRGRINRHER